MSKEESRRPDDGRLLSLLYEDYQNNCRVLIIKFLVLTKLQNAIL